LEKRAEPKSGLLSSCLNYRGGQEDVIIEPLLWLGLSLMSTHLFLIKVLERRTHSFHMTNLRHMEAKIFAKSLTVVGSGSG
jgi:hypothetical protein